MLRLRRFSTGHSRGNGRIAVLAVFLCSVSSQSCVLDSPMEQKGLPAATFSAAERFAGTKWRLVEIQSMDDAIGTTRPSDRDLYTLDLNRDGTAAMRLNCNRGVGQWSAKPIANGAEGSFSIGPLAMTRALCPPRSLDERIAPDMDYVWPFLLKDGASMILARQSPKIALRPRPGIKKGPSCWCWLAHPLYAGSLAVKGQI